VPSMRYLEQTQQRVAAIDAALHKRKLGPAHSFGPTAIDQR
jgi:hypothetical protein